MKNLPKHLLNNCHLRRLIFVAVLLFCPWSTKAAVTISEIAWMGDSVSANYEWIELYNDGASLNVDGWALVDEFSLNIVLSGTISSNSYVVLERNRSSGQYLSNTPFLIYTGSLINTGATLVLKDVNGTIIDQVAGGENWSNVGGDNTTKETAQYTINGWRTGLPTPGSSNISSSGSNSSSTEPVVNNTNKNSNSDSGSNKAASSTVRLNIPNAPLSLLIDVQKTTYVNQATKFNITPNGFSPTLLNSLSYEWNFGDFSTSSQKNPTHVYKYPGTYIVTVRASFAKEAQVARQEITVLPVNISLVNDGKNLLVNNNAPFDVDVSGYSLVGQRSLVFPPRSIIGTKGTVAVPLNKLGVNLSQNVVLFDSAKDVAALSNTGLSLLKNNEDDFVFLTPSPVISFLDTPTITKTVDDPVSSNELGQATAPEIFDPLIIVPKNMVSAQDKTTLSLPDYVFKAFLPKTEANTPTKSFWSYGAFIALLVLVIGMLAMTKKMSSVTDDL